MQKRDETVSDAQINFAECVPTMCVFWWQLNTKSSFDFVSNFCLWQMKNLFQRTIELCDQPSLCQWCGKSVVKTPSLQSDARNAILMVTIATQTDNCEHKIMVKSSFENVFVWCLHVMAFWNAEDWRMHGHEMLVMCVNVWLCASMMHWLRWRILTLSTRSYSLIHGTCWGTKISSEWWFLSR